MNQIQGQVAEREANNWLHRVRLFVWGVEAGLTGAFNGLAARGAAVAVLFFALSLGASGYVLAAAENSVPGDSLYQVKLAVEDARLSMARSQKSRVALEVEFASRRLQEVKTLAESRDEGAIHASVLVAQFQNDLNKFSVATNELSADSPESGAEVAKLIEGKLEDYRHTLASTTVTDPTLKKELNRAITTVARTQTQTLKVIVEEDETPDQSVVDKIADKIRLAEQSLRESDAKLADDNLFEGGGTKEVREQSAIAKVNLVEARQKVDEGDYRAAVGIIDQIEDLVYGVEEAVDEADGQVEGVSDEVEGGSESEENTSTDVGDGIPSTSSGQDPSTAEAAQGDQTED